jgi:hypothetical protein
LLLFDAFSELLSALGLSFSGQNLRHDVLTLT